MANVDYDFAFASFLRYDYLHPSLFAGIRNKIAEAISIFPGSLVLGTARIRDDAVHVRIRADDSFSTFAIKRRVKATISLHLLETDATIKSDTKGKITWDRDTWIATGNPGNAAADAFLDSKPQHPRP